jgi:hypothetical protein
LNQKEQIEDYLGKVLGRGGRIRTTNDPLERMRKAVEKAIKGALKAIKEQDSDFYDYLNGAIRTGKDCSFRPPDRKR